MIARFPVSAELGLLAACDLADDAALGQQLAAAMEAGTGFDWDRFAGLARAHSMAGLVSARLAALGAGGEAGRIAALLSGYIPSAAVLQLAQTGAAAALTEALAGAGIRTLVLKGMALSHMFYPAAPWWRTASDIDLLIAPEDLAAADRAMMAAGYERRWPQEGLPRRGQAMFLRLANVFDYVHRGNGQLVELHHRLTLNPHWAPAGFDVLYRASAEVPTDQGPIRGLDGPHLVSYLCWHAFAHAGFRLKWICDIVRALRHAGAGSAAALCPAGAGFPQAHLELADVLVAAFLAPGAIDPTAAARWERQVRRIIADMEAPSELPTGRSLALLRGEIGFRLFLARLSPGARGKGYELLRAAADPRDARLLGLGTRFAPLYVLLGPVLALRRYALRLAGRADAAPHLH